MRKTHKCLRCGYIWLSELDEPTKCPRCHNSCWNKARRFNTGPKRKKVPLLVEVMVVKHGVTMPLSELSSLEQAATIIAQRFGITIDVDKWLGFLAHQKELTGLEEQEQ